MVNLLAFALPLVLAATFSLAAWGKLSDQPLLLSRPNTRPSWTALIVPIELYVAGLLLFSGPSAGAAALTVVFVLAATVYLITFGRGAACHCFGQARPVPWRVAILRNTALLAGSAMLFVLPSPSTRDVLSAIVTFDWIRPSILAVAYLVGVVTIHNAWMVSAHSLLAVGNKGGTRV